MLWDFLPQLIKRIDPHVSKRFSVASVEIRLSEGDKGGDINILRFGNFEVWSTIYVAKCLYFI